MQYYDLKKNWTHKVAPHLSNPRVVQVLVSEMDKYTFSRWGKHFTAHDTPSRFDSCDWRCEHRGKEPRFWEYASHGKCHWLVNFNLELARLTMPNRPWRIRTSQKHSTVWDGKGMLFDINFLALGVSPQECFDLASGRDLKIGRHLVTHTVPHWKTEIK